MVKSKGHRDKDRAKLSVHRSELRGCSYSFDFLEVDRKCDRRRDLVGSRGLCTFGTSPEMGVARPPCGNRRCRTLRFRSCASPDYFTADKSCQVALFLLTHSEAGERHLFPYGLYADPKKHCTVVTAQPDQFVAGAETSIATFLCDSEIEDSKCPACPPEVPRELVALVPGSRTIGSVLNRTEAKSHLGERAGTSPARLHSAALNGVHKVSQAVFVSSSTQPGDRSGHLKAQLNKKQIIAWMND